MLSQIPWKILVLIMVGIAWLAGMFPDVMDVDAAQYGSMSQSMAMSGDFLHLFDLNQPYLDKPPLIFWLTTISFKIFGVSNFSYRLPSVLFALLALWSTYKLTLLYYSRNTAQAALLILATCQCFFTMNTDVKTDMYLIGAVMFSVWQLCLHLETRRWSAIFLGFFGLGLGMLSKGPLGVMIPMLAIGGDRFLRRDWWGIFNWRWLLGLPVLALVVLPFCIGLYEQFGNEGLEFFFWKQSFGRITGESKWVNDAGPFFLVQTFAWAFLPWTLLLVAGFWRQFRETLFSRLRIGPNIEGVAFAGFLLVFLAFTFSRFKLPHYIFVVAPFAAIQVAGWLERITHEVTREGRMRSWANFQFGLAVTLLVVGFLLFYFAFGLSISLGIFFLFSMIMIFLSFQGINDHLWRMLIPSAIALVTINLTLNLQIYPKLLAYQVSASVGKEIKAGKYPVDRFYTFFAFSRALDFYSGHVFIPLIPSLKSKKRRRSRETFTFLLQMKDFQR